MNINETDVQPIASEMAASPRETLRGILVFVYIIWSENTNIKCEKWLSNGQCAAPPAAGEYTAIKYYHQSAAVCRLFVYCIVVCDHVDQLGHQRLAVFVVNDTLLGLMDMPAA